MGKVFFDWCVLVLEYAGELTGLGYVWINILIFVIGQPLLILFFMILWLREKRRFKCHKMTNERFLK